MTQYTIHRRLKKGDRVWLLGDMGSPYAYGKIIGPATHDRWWVRYHYQGPHTPNSSKSQIRRERIKIRRRGDMLTLRHYCHAVRCFVQVPPKMLMCKRHWTMVPRKLQKKVWDHYREGQEHNKKPSSEYLMAAWSAIKSVGRIELAREKGCEGFGIMDL